MPQASSPTRTFRRATSLSAAAVLALSLTACGSSSDSDSANDTAAAGATDAFPVTIKHQFGESTIDQKPERVVAGSAQYADILVEFGVQPEAYVLTSPGFDDMPYLDGRFQKEPDQSLWNADFTMPPEAFVKHNPDVLFMPGYPMSQGDSYQKMSQIAPVVTGEQTNIDWVDAMNQVGTVMGMADQVDAKVEEAAKPMTDLAAAHPELDGMTYNWVSWTPTEKIFNYGNGSIFETLGMKPAEGQDNTQNNRAGVSFENLDKLNADFITVWCSAGDECKDLKEDDRFQSLPAAKAGRVLYVNLDAANAINSPSPSAIGYIADQVKPVLESAAKQTS